MRLGAILLAVLTGALAPAGGAALGGHPVGRSSPVATVALTRAELTDSVGFGVALHTRDESARELDARRDLAAVLALALVPLAGGWWLLVERRAASDRGGMRALQRPRAPPRVSVTVRL
jgi:hypothetical protein